MASYLSKILDAILGQSVASPEYARVINIIKDNYGDDVVVKSKDLLKFGRNENLGQNTELVWMNGANEAFETYLSDNLIDRVSSTNAGDTQNVRIEGHTVDGNGDFSFVVQFVDLNGQTPVSLVTPLARVSRIKNRGVSIFAGEIYVYENSAVTNGEPGDKSKVHITANLTTNSTNQSFKSATTLSSVDYWALTAFDCSVNKKTTAVVDFAIKVRQEGRAFTEVYPLSVPSSSSGKFVPFNPPIIIPKNSDVLVEASSTVADTSVTACLHGYLLTKSS